MRCSIPRPRTERSPRSRGRRPAADPAHCSPTFNSGLWSHLQSAGWHEKPDQTGRPERRFPQVAHRGRPRMRTAFCVCVWGEVCVRTCIREYEIMIWESLFCGNPWVVWVAACVLCLKRVSVCSNAKKRKGKKKKFKKKKTNYCCSSWRTVFNVAPTYIDVQDFIFLFGIRSFSRSL